MKKSTWIVAASLIMLFSCSEAPAKSQDQKTDASRQETAAKKKAVQLIGQEEFLSQIFDYRRNKEWKYAGKQPCIVDFYADWCAPCRMLSPVLEKLAEEYQGKIVVYKVDTQAETQLSADMGIQALPTLLFCPMEGDPVATRGYMEEAQLKEIIEDVLLKQK